jgi:hypothetical protein
VLTKISITDHLWTQCHSFLPPAVSIFLRPPHRTGDQHDAYSAAAWMRQADLDGSLVGFFDPYLSPSERTVAQVEGWILGVK